MYDEEDYLQLSGIQHFRYCKRQWALIHLEQVWSDDARTAAGYVFHGKVDDPFSDRTRGGSVISRSIPVSSRDLGLSGVCDVVELHPCPGGIKVAGHIGAFTVVPVEYKVGRRKGGDWDAVQLCAEAMALEESLGAGIERGFLYYGAERRRQEVLIDDDLRSTTKGLADEMHEMYEGRRLPPPDRTSRCKGCSLINLCMPHMDAFPDVLAYLIKTREWI